MTVLIIVLLATLLMDRDVMSQNNALHLETRRKLDESYQRDRADYTRRIHQAQYLLSVRADESLKRLLRSTHVRVINRGRAEAFARANVVYFDMAVLDLLAHFSDELSLAEVKSDAIHQLEFNLAYAAALNGDKDLALLDPYNTMVYTEEQKAYLWNGKLRSEEVIFSQILGFILAHEISHLALGHEQMVQNEFPDEQTHSTSNPDWNKRRREMELAADEMAAQVCLNALVQPAQLLPWLDLNEIRRRYYGKSPEYPTAAQRLTVIQRAYAGILDPDPLGGDILRYKPLAPDRDVTQTDYNLYLGEFRKIRAYRQSLLSGIDESLITLINEQYSLEEVASTFVAWVEQQKDLLRGAEHKEALDQLILVVSGTADRTTVDVTPVMSLLEDAGIGEHARAMIFDLLENDPVDWDQVTGHLSVLEKAPGQFLLGLTYDYLLANTALRWHPDAFASLQAALPDTEAKAKKLKPYRLGQPLRNPLPTFEERVEVLRTWHGQYADPNTH